MRAEEKSRDKKQSKRNFLVKKKVEEINKFGRGMKFLLPYVTMV